KCMLVATIRNALLLALLRSRVRREGKAMDPMTAAGGVTGLTETGRERITFRSGADDCAAWYYRGSNSACVVMAGGAGVTKEPATDRFAARFQAAGYSVLAFDHRHLGESGGTP